MRKRRNGQSHRTLTPAPLPHAGEGSSLELFNVDLRRALKVVERLLFLG
jgi:hypothetical protein